MPPETDRPRLLFLVTEDWYFWSHRLPIARAARDAGFEVAVAARVSEHAGHIRGEGFRLFPLPWRRRGSSLASEVRALTEIVRLYVRERPDIVHHVALRPVVYGSIARRLARVPRVVNAINGLGFVFTADSLRARAARLALLPLFRLLVDGRQTLALFQNKDDRDRLVTGGFLARARTAVVPGSGIDLAHFTPLPEPSSGPPTIAVVSRMLTIKGIETLVQASRMLRQRGVVHRLLLAGAPDPDSPAAIPIETLQAWAAEPGVVWLGHCADPRTVWAQAHVAALTSFGGEGLPKTLLEAAACGRPIVATDVPGSRDVARDGHNALLVPPRDPAATADALERLVFDPALRARFGVAGRRLVEAEHSDQTIAAAVLAEYRKLLFCARDTGRQPGTGDLGSV